LKRLGAGLKGSENDYTILKNHSLFKDFDWTKLSEMKPPIFEIVGPKKKKTTLEGEKAEKLEAKKSNGDVEVKQVPSIIDKNITIILSGLVDKKCGWIFYKPRQLILNSKPRLMYYDPNTNQLRVY
jgi:hypothetical protein